MPEPSTDVRVLRFVEDTLAEGPGRRCALWVQGCTIRCPGCFNPHSWPAAGGTLVPWPDLARRVAAAPDVEGLTLLGGEPFDQAAALAPLAEATRATGRSVMTFTGHTLQELRAANCPDTDRLLAATDLLVDGPYRAEQSETERPWVGSRNQRFHCLTPRYADLSGKLGELPNRVEIRIGADGTVLLNGFATVESTRALLAGEFEAPHPTPLARRRRR
ncbi:MAG: 4Fe-4S single cluster domain-containing protein [Sporichthyaceae bacterium]